MNFLYFLKACIACVFVLAWLRLILIEIRLYLALSGCLWLPLSLFGSFWLPVALSGPLLPSLVLTVSHWLSLAHSGLLWLSLWLSLTLSYSLFFWDFADKVFLCLTGPLLSSQRRYCVAALYPGRHGKNLWISTNVFSASEKLAHKRIIKQTIYTKCIKLAQNA